MHIWCVHWYKQRRYRPCEIFECDLETNKKKIIKSFWSKKIRFRYVEGATFHIYTRCMCTNVWYACVCVFVCERAHIISIRCKPFPKWSVRIWLLANEQSEDENKDHLVIITQNVSHDKVCPTIANAVQLNRARDQTRSQHTQLNCQWATGGNEFRVYKKRKKKKETFKQSDS